MYENIRIFKGMTEDDRAEAVKGLRGREKSFEKDELILHAGSPTATMGVVLAGSVTIENNDLWGNRTILGHVGTGGVFAEAYALLEEESMLVDVRANEGCRILMLDLTQLRRGSWQTAWQQKIALNLLRISAQKNRNLSERSFHTSPRTIRGRVLSYLDAASRKKGSSEFEIPFDRQQMADYLNVERTALSKELGKMRRAGLIEFHKSRFRLKG